MSGPEPLENTGRNVELSLADWVFYRLIDVPRVREEHFYTHEQLGKPLLREKYRDQWSRGISVFSDREEAIRKASVIRNPVCTYMVMLKIPRTSSLRLEQTGAAFHYTIWDADPAELIGYVSGDPERIRDR